MRTIQIDVDMNNLPECVRDVFKDTQESCHDYELVSIKHSKLVDEYKVVDTEFWELAFYEKGIMDWLYFVKLTIQPWNTVPIHEDCLIVPMRTMDEIVQKVEEIRNGKHEHL